MGFRLITRKEEDTHGTSDTKTIPESSESTRMASVTGYADMILMNGNVLTVDSNDSIVEAVAAKDGKIIGSGII